MEGLKLVAAGLVLYLSPSAFVELHRRWWPGSADDDQVRSSAWIMRRRFWRSFATVMTVVLATVVVLRVCGLANVLQWRYLLRAAAVVLVLTATLGRGGWETQTWGGQAVYERIDRGMWKISQLGASVLLLLALAL